jgi:hypothetical protein
MDDFEKILSKALSHPDYANTLRYHTETAMKELGVAPTPEKVKALREAVTALVTAHIAFAGAEPD